MSLNEGKTHLGAMHVLAIIDHGHGAELTMLYDRELLHLEIFRLIAI